MSSIRVFLSFDLGHDRDLKKRLLAEAAKAGSGFEVLGCSEVGRPMEGMSERVRAQIAAADEVLVICGAHTEDSLQVSAELSIAQEEQKPYMLLWGRREAMCTRPRGARPGDSMYSWTAPILRDQLAMTLRVARALEVPDRCKRP